MATLILKLFAGQDTGTDGRTDGETMWRLYAFPFWEHKNEQLFQLCLYAFVSTIFNEGAYLTFKSSIRPSKMVLLLFEKEPVFPFLMLSAKQGNYWYHF